ncbi:unnamed protein product [Boreogadus saida]
MIGPLIGVGPGASAQASPCIKAALHTAHAGNHVSCAANRKPCCPDPSTGFQPTATALANGEMETSGPRSATRALECDEHSSE